MNLAVSGPRAIRVVRALALVLVLVLGLVPPRPAHACCAAPPPGVHVQIADQEVLIVWDAERKLEHFVRRAAFGTQAARFGFLVPTPTVPELAEAPDGVFASLEKAIEPERVHRKRLELGSLLLAPFLLAAGKAAPEAALSRSVRVLSAQRVAGYDAVVLEATDAKALADWLARNEFETRPEMADWLEPYVTRGWKVTAFKLAAPDDGSAGGGAGSTRYAVRMSFATERPLFPYRTPADQHGPGRTGAGTLRLHVVAAERMGGLLGERGWDARIAYARPRPDIPALVAGALPEASRVAPGMWLTTFEDRQWPRPSDDDLYFLPETQQAEVVPPPIVFWHDVLVPVDVIGIAVVLGGVVVWRVRKKRRAPKTL